MIIIQGDRAVYTYGRNSSYRVGDFYVFGGDTGSYVLDERLLQAIVTISDYYFVKKVRIHSAYRTKAHNDSLRKLGYRSSETSLHLSGQAIDFSFGTGMQAFDTRFRTDIQSRTSLIYQQLIGLGIGEFIFDDHYTHIAVQSKVEIINNTGQLTEIGKVAVDDNKKRDDVPISREYYEYYHQDSSITKISTFVDDSNSVAINFKSAIGQLLQYKNSDNYSNLDRLWELYSEAQKNTFSSEYKELSERLASATGSARTDLMTQRTKVKLQYSENVDYDLNVGTLLYIPKSKANLETITAVGKDLFMKQQNLKTYLYDEYQALINDPTYIPTARTLIKGSYYSVNYLHISLSCWIYIRALDKIINVTPFVRTMDTDVGEEGGTFNISLNDIQDINNVQQYSETFYAYSYKTRDSRYILSFFQKYIQQNDIVFLRFERLDIEGDDDMRSNKLEIQRSELANKIYDMIGLVDASSESYASAANVSTLSINGRDLTKLIVEDGCYFFPFALQNGGKEFFLNYNSADTVFKRLFVTGEFKTPFTALFRSIRDSLGFIFNQLTNVGVLPRSTDLFDAYKASYNRVTGQTEDRQSKVYEISDATRNYLDTVEQNGIWKIIKVIVDHQLDERRLNNGELSSPEGTIRDLIMKICLTPFVEFWGDTLGDQFVFMARQPPFTKDQIKDYFDNNMIIEVTADQVMDIDLHWDDTYYTWYQLQPLDGLFGSDQFVAGTRMPIVYFEEFAQLFGMHKKVISDSYIAMGVLSGDQQKTDVDLYRQMLANDLKFLIESHSILPFTRKGSLRIIGERRIKRGSWIWFRPTNEIFYVKKVSNSVGIMGNTIDRTTRLQVERGMIKDFALDETDIMINGKRANYFDIVNMKVIMDSLQVKLADDQVKTTQTGTNVQLIDTDLFNFFVQRKQWDEKR